MYNCMCWCGVKQAILFALPGRVQGELLSINDKEKSFATKAY